MIRYSCRSLFMVVAGCCFLWADTTTVQYYKIPITIYDYHSDGSNMEFGATAQNKFLNTWQLPGICSGLAATTLDQNKKIVKNPGVTNPLFCVDHINKWYRPWVAGDTVMYLWDGDTTYAKIGTTIVPFVIGTDTLWWDTLMVCDSTHIVHVPGEPIACDTCFKNVVIPDSLKGIDQNGTGIYVATFSSNILDGLGFGNEGKTHNECVSMELHNQFVYHIGNSLLCGGDDDFWVYLNGQLAIDGGGYHAYQSRTISLDTFGLVAGQTYDIDVFWADRVAGGSFRMEGDLVFLHKISGVDTVTTGIIPRTSKNGLFRWSLSGKNGIVLPQSTSKVSWDIFDCSGRMLHHAQDVDRSMAQAALSRSMALQHGIVIVRVQYFDALGKQILSDVVRLHSSW